MRHLHALLLLVMAACVVGGTPPPPELTVTSPERGLVQGGAGQILVAGVARPGSDGAAIARVSVNPVPAALAADGSFTAIVDVPPGAMLLETVATSTAGGSATDARAVQIGELRPVGTSIDRAITATLSAEAFARLSAAAGPILTTTDFDALLAPLQPMASLGDSIANLKLSVTRLTLTGARITLVPTDGGLAFTAQLDGLDVAANAAYGGTLVIDGSTSIGITADQLTIAGTLAVTPAGTVGFTTKIMSPAVRTTALRLQASGLAGQVLGLMTDNLGSTIQDIATRSAERALEPLINDALGALAGPQRLDVLGETLSLQTSPHAITFSRDGALVALNVMAKLDGSEASPGYVFTPNGTPTLDVTRGIQLGLADDLMNELLAQVHALGLLDIHLEQDVGVFDTIEIKLSMPPMISANNPDGTMRLVLGDMIATFTDDGATIISAAINAQVELEIQRADDPQDLALQFGKVHVFVNVLDTSDDGGLDLSGAATAGISLQLDSLSQFLITVPVPSVAGVTLDSLSLRADSGYVVVSGAVR